MGGEGEGDEGRELCNLGVESIGSIVVVLSVDGASWELGRIAIDRLRCCSELLAVS